MNLVRLQRLLARLYTDDAFREQMLKAPEVFAQSEGWSAEDLAEFLQLSQPQIQFFADTLKKKRLQEVQKILPLTFYLQPKQRREQFLVFSKTFIPQGLKKHLEDAYQFVQFLLAFENKIVFQEPYEKEWIRYEFFWLRIRIEKWKRPFCFGSYFRYPIKKIVRSCLSEKNSVSFAPQTTFAVWFRFRTNGPLYHYVWSFPFQRKEKTPFYE